MAEPQTKSRRGGARPGAGRKPKGYVKPSALSALGLTAALAAPPPDEIDSVAQAHARDVLASLVNVLVHGKSEVAKIAAAKEILDRGYGKPTVEIGGDAAMLPFMLAPPSAEPSVQAEIRVAARKHATLAVDTLRKIAIDGSSEAAITAAARALLDRGLGTVGKARMPEEQRDRPLGKKEEAARAAEIAASGPFATPLAPARRLS
ncbi:hypothetical protein DFR50_14268 [Roseiarcus fermentans]|uniref:Uncharacterized protein n=1 Tax=Roseiarcus fermentans TaxID=1473586 RepID=A0A366EQ53_9HYPH|nr:hypothetical protein [Roseiarcus fermentans]RBP03820.1 hypothetical protein DFR50_14268 [Roseiarcus fermentans]